MYTLYKFHFLNGISEINQLFDDILIIWPAPVYENYVASCGFFDLRKRKKTLSGLLLLFFMIKWQYLKALSSTIIMDYAVIYV